MTGLPRAATGGRAVLDDRPIGTDVVVVGSGAAGLAAAVSAAATGAAVVLVEKADRIGGTTAKSGGVFWVPGNRHQTALGIHEDRDLVLRYISRVSAPDRYDDAVPGYGLNQWERDLLSAYVDDCPAVLDALEDLGVLHSTLAAGGDFPDYHCELPEQGGVRGRALSPVKPDGGAGTGSDLVDQLLVGAERFGVQILTGTTFEDLLLEGDRVTGVLVRSSGRQFSVLANGGVVLAAGGFTHDPERRGNLPGMVWGGCAVGENSGDVLAPLEALAVPLVNMDCAWWDQVAVEHVIHGRTETRAGVWVAPGDSSVIVNLRGERVVNEKATYNTRAKVHHGPDAPKLLLLLLDQRALVEFSSEEFAYPVAPADTTDPTHIISAGSWLELAGAVDARLQQLGHLVGQARIEHGFTSRLEATISAYGDAARAGVDREFNRGEQPIEIFFSGDARPGCGPNPTMAPFADEGPYHAVLIGLGTLDTKGGPRTDRSGRVLDLQGSPVPGLYAAGNCAASPSGQGYWAAGATIGSALTFGFAAGRHAARSRWTATSPSMTDRATHTAG